MMRMSRACLKGRCHECDDPDCACPDDGPPVEPLSDLDNAYRVHWDPDYGDEPDSPRNLRAALDPYQYDV